MKILVTGGSSALGRAMIERLRREGHELFTTASSADSCARLERELPEVPVYLLDFAAGEAWGPRFAERLGALDGLILNAMPKTDALKKFTEFSPAEIEEALRVGLFGQLLVARTALAGMAARRRGRLLLVSSLSVGGMENYPLYGAVKAALEGLFLNIAVDYAAEGVQANILRPGFVKTERTRRFWESEGYRKRMEKILPLGRLAEPAEIAEAVPPFFAAASYLNGVILPLGGGLPQTRMTSLLFP